MIEQGAVIEIARGGHKKAYIPGGPVMTYGMTPSDKRAVMNAWSVWRKLNRQPSSPPKG